MPAAVLGVSGRKNTLVLKTGQTDHKYTIDFNSNGLHF